MSRQTFTKADRLLQRSEFVYLSKHGRRVHSRYFIAQVCKNDFDRCRLGITVTRKVGKAALRNQLKRHAREVFRRNRHIFNGPWDINVIMKKEAVALLETGPGLALESFFAQIDKQMQS